MLRYTVIANSVLEIKLPFNEDYSVVAFIRWNNMHDSYYASLYIKNKLVERLDIMDEFESIQLEASDLISAKNEIVKFIDLNCENKFASYILRTEYELNCFDRGNELYEMEKNHD